MSASAGPPPLPTRLNNYDIRTLAVIHILEAISIILVAFRVYWRVRERKNWLWRWMWTDVFLVLALLFQIGVQVLNVFEILETLQQYQNRGWTPYAGVDASFLTVIALWCLRISVALLFLEIFPGRETRWIAHTAIVLITIMSWFRIFYFGSCFWPLAARNAPVFEVFTECTKPGKPMYPNMIMHSLSAVIFDILAVVLPVIPVWSLHMSIAKKLSVIAIFALGWLTVASSVTMFVISIRVVQGEVTPGMMANLTIFSAVEVHVGLIATSLITSWRVLRRMIFTPSTSRTTSIEGLAPAVEDGKYKDLEKMKTESAGDPSLEEKY